MKKILLATTVLASFAGAASAEVVFSGYGRFGLEYNSAPNTTNYTDGTKAGTVAVHGTNGFASSVISDRIRLNIDGKTVTDGGITFGGRIRIQSSSGQTNGAGDPGGSINAPQLYAVANGFRLEVGNVNEALDSVALFYNSEMGYEDSSNGEAYGFYSYASTPGDYGTYKANRNVVFFSYAMAGLNVRASYIKPDQAFAKNPVGTAAEFSASADYVYGPFTFAAGGAAHAKGVSKAFYNFVGAAYAVSPDINVGLNYNNANNIVLPGYTSYTAFPGDGSQVTSITTLYGNYTMGAITLRAYVAGTNADYVKQKYVGGLGADYALGGGTRISGSIRPDYAGNTTADVGVRFDF
jgi:outer membrane protein OmpU